MSTHFLDNRNNIWFVNYISRWIFALSFMWCFAQSSMLMVQKAVGCGEWSWSQGAQPRRESLIRTSSKRIKSGQFRPPFLIHLTCSQNHTDARAVRPMKSTPDLPLQIIKLCKFNLTDIKWEPKVDAALGKLFRHTWSWLVVWNAVIDEDSQADRKENYLDQGDACNVSFSKVCVSPAWRWQAGVLADSSNQTALNSIMV